MNTAPTTARKGFNKNSARKAAPPITPPTPREAPAFSRGGAIQGEIQNAVLNLQPGDFLAWADTNFGDIEVRHQQIARTLLSTFIEESLQIRHGVYFADESTVQIGWVKTSFMKIDAAYWMTAFIRSLPKADWSRIKA